MGGLLGRFVRAEAALLSEWLRRLADEIEKLEPGPAVAAAPVVFLREGEVLMGEITVKDSDGPLSATVRFLDAKGAPTEPDDVPTWSSTDVDVATVEASEDGKSATVSIGTPGAAVIAVESTDSDGTRVEAQGTVTVQPGEAVLGDVTFAPTGETPAPPPTP